MEDSSPGTASFSNTAPTATTPSAGRRRLGGHAGISRTSTTTSPMIEVRDTVSGSAAPMRITGSHRRNQPVRSGSNACWIAKGNRIESTAASSSGCAALLEGRTNAPRTINAVTSAPGRSPGMCTLASRLLEVKNSTMPSAPMKLPYTTMRRSTSCRSA